MYHCQAVDEVEHRGPDDSRQGVQQTHGAENFTSAVMRHMFGQCCLESRRAHAAKSGDDTGEDEQQAGVCGGVANVAEEVEGDGDADNREIDAVGAGVLLDRGAFGPTQDAGDQGEENKEDGYAAGVDDGDKDAGFESLPAKRELGVDDDDGHGAHGHAEHGGVDRSQEDQVTAQGGT